MIIITQLIFFKSIKQWVCFWKNDQVSMSLEISSNHAHDLLIHNEFEQFYDKNLNKEIYIFSIESDNPYAYGERTF